MEGSVTTWILATAMRWRAASSLSKASLTISDTDGVLFSSGWLLVDRAWYYAAASGEIETGWLKLGGTWYYLDPSRGVPC